MPAIRHSSKRKAPPEGFSDIENDLLIFANKMKDAQNKPPPPGPKHQAQWEIFQIAHQRSRYVYDLYYEKEAISKQLYEWLLKNGYADAMLIAKWKKQGYEKVCSSQFSTHRTKLTLLSFAASAASRPKKQTSTALAFAEFPELP
jgi:bud site selection protein 31